jgi:hypothetical protein
MAAQDSDESAVEITRMALRGGGWVGYSDDAVYVDREDDDRVKIHNDAITRVGLRWLEWDVAVMSVLLVGVGGFVTLTRNPLVGVAFVVIGVASCYRTYRKRWEVTIRVQDRRKPVAVHPEHPEECQSRLADRVGLE